MASSKGNRRNQRRKRTLDQRSAKAAAASPAHHWDALFGQALRFAAANVGGRTEDDLVAFLARGRLRDGRRVLKAFLDDAPLSDAEEIVVRSWTALHASLYERLELRGTRIVVRDLTTWEEHVAAVVHPVAAEAFEEVVYGALILLPTPDGPVLGGEVRGVRPDATRQDALAVAANLCATFPRLCQRAHPTVVATMLAEEHAAFRAFAGQAYLQVATGELPTVLSSFAQVFSGSTVDGFQAAGLFNVTSNDEPVGLIHDPTWGFQLVPGLDRFLEGVAADNALTVEAWLKDGGVSPAAFTVAHACFPDSLDGALSGVLGRTTHWPRAAEELVRTYKPRFARPFPHLYPVPEEVARARRPPPPDGLGLNRLLDLEAR